MSDRVAGRVALVTGAARGIGRSIALALRREGARVVIADLDETAARGAAGELGLDWRKLDVRQPAEWADAVVAIERDVGAIDILVNNAGIMSLGEFLGLPDAVDRRQFEVNVFGLAYGMRAVLPGMLARGRGHVINLASAAGKVGTPYASMYSATKHAVVGLTEAVRLEHRGSGVHFTYVMPTLVNTELIAGSKKPLFPPVVEPDEVADAVVRSLETREVDVYVPRIGRLLSVAPAILPRPVYESIGRALRLMDMFASIDRDRRAAYDNRALNR